MANPFNLTVGSSVVVVRAKRNKRYYTEDELIVCSVETVGRKYFTIKGAAYGARFRTEDLCEDNPNVSHLVFTDVQHFRESQERDRIQDALGDYTYTIRSRSHLIRELPIEDLRTVMRLLRIQVKEDK